MDRRADPRFRRECAVSRSVLRLADIVPPLWAGAPNLLEAPGAADALPANLSLRLNFLPFLLGKGMD